MARLNFVSGLNTGDKRIGDIAVVQRTRNPNPLVRTSRLSSGRRPMPRRFHNLKPALPRLARTPLSSSVTITTLDLGIGENVAVFCVI